ncbi:MAG: sigma-70 family RNA polymerase sigma factor [Oscillospiraceae bacterium]|nr:sigma-70 family RNA polymerase sigma factor [Oscillospiraceae bacterium]
MKDEQIIDLLFQRSEDGILALECTYGRLCRTLAFGILNDREDADECVNDAWLGVWNAIPPARPAILSAYVCKIVRNLSLKRYRKNHAEKRNSAHAVSMAELEDCLTAPDRAETRLETAELTRSIEEFLDSLTAENRVIFLQRYWFARSCAEIAAQTGLREGTVTVRLTRLRQQLRTHLTERGML